MPKIYSSKTLIPSSPSLSHPHPKTLTADDLKRAAAYTAADQITSDTIVGLGTGSTAAHFLHRLASRLAAGELSGVQGVPTSKQTESLAIALNIPLTNLTSNTVINISVDGADEIDSNLNLVKGRGGSLLREKMVESASRQFVVIADESKMVEKIGKYIIPVEIVTFGWEYTVMKLRNLFEAKGLRVELRIRKCGNGGKMFVTDNLNYVVDLFFKDGVEGDLEELSDEILRVVGVVEHGMFLGMATEVIVAGKDGIVRQSKEDVLATRRR